MSSAATRASAARLICQVLDGQSLGALMPAAQARLADRDDGALLQELVYEGLRQWHRLDALAGLLLQKPLKAKDADVHALIALGLLQLTAMRVPAHAAVAETVNACKNLKKPWARGMINACLRRFQRESEALLAEVEQRPEARLNHPAWLIERLQADWPEQAEAIMAANNGRGPMTLRVNRRHLDRDAYLAELADQGIEAVACRHSPVGVRLARPMPVQALPGFREGRVSVQDEAAQLAGELLPLAPGMRVLDACAAPGGKTGHLLEREPAIELTALDVDAERLARVEENLERLDLAAGVIVGDAAAPDAWWDGQLFDAMLVDAPCSGTGVIRRHPDIKWLRREADVDALAQRQQAILNGLWPLLRPGGKLLYVTCSVCRAENDATITTFVGQHSDARAGEPFPWQTGIDTPAGRQVLPGGEDNMDGFFYACLDKLC